MAVLRLGLFIIANWLLMPALAAEDDSGIAGVDIQALVQESEDELYPQSRTVTSHKAKPCQIHIYSAHSVSAFINAYSDKQGDAYSKAQQASFTTTANPGKTQTLILPCTGKYTLEAMPLSSGYAFGRKQCESIGIPLHRPGSSAAIVYPAWFHANCGKATLFR